MRLNFYQKIIVGTVISMAVLVVTICSVNYLQSRNTLHTLAEKSLQTSTNDLYNVLTMHNDALLKQFKGPVATIEADIEREGGLFINADQMVEMTVKDQDTLRSEEIHFPTLYAGLSKAYGATELVDKIWNISGTSASIFQVLPDKLLRVSTTIKDSNGERVVGTYISSESPVYRTLMQDRDYKGTANILGETYLALYHPLKDMDGNIVAVIFVGLKIMTPEFKRLIESIHIAGKGYAFLLGSKGDVILHPGMSGKSFSKDHPGTWKQIRGHKKWLGSYEQGSHEHVIHTRLFDPWGWYIGVSLDKDEMLFGMDTKALISGGIIVLLSITLFTIILLVMLRFLLRPLLDLAQTAKHIAAGDLDARATYDRKDAIGDTVKAVNTMGVEIKKKLGFASGVLEGITLPGAVIDHRNQLTFINQAMLDILESDLSREACTGKSIGEIVHGDQEAETIAERSLTSKEQICEEIVYTTQRGTQRIVSITATPVFDLDKNLLGVLSLWVDLSEIRIQQKKIEEQNQRIARAAQETESVAEQISSASEELAAQVEESSRGADTQLIQAEETQVAIGQMSSTAMDVAQNAALASNLAEETKTKAEEGVGVVRDMVGLIDAVAGVSIDLQRDMGELGTQAHGIGDIMGVISDIADQTNLLALNAAIEAARAGDAGRGFAVVADEVRKLAEKTMVATKEVGGAIASIQQSADTSISASKKSSKLIEKTTELAGISGKTLEEMVGKIQKNADQIMRIAAAAEEQSAANEEIRGAIENIHSISAETAQAMTESAQAITELAQLAQKLKTGMKNMTQDR